MPDDRILEPFYIKIEKYAHQALTKQTEVYRKPGTISRRIQKDLHCSTCPLDPLRDRLECGCVLPWHHAFNIFHVSRFFLKLNVLFCGCLLSI